MRVFYHRFFQFAWVAFWLYWLIQSCRVKRTKQAESRFGRIIHGALFCFAFVLLALPFFHRGLLGRELLPGVFIRFWVGAGILIAGLAFAVWARFHIGSNWSGNVTLKEGHRLIRTGPYALVRHPIYTGILLGFLGTAMAQGEVRSFVGFIIFLVIHLFKLRKEERWMEQEFGEEYVQYREQVPALMPFGPV